MSDLEQRAVAPPIDPNDALVGQTLSSPNGAPQIIEKITSATDHLESFTISTIDSLIARLEGLKEHVKLRSTANRSATVDYVNLVDKSAREVQVLTDLVDQIETRVEGTK